MHDANNLFSKNFLGHDGIPFARIPEPNIDDEHATARLMSEGVNPVKAWREYRKIDLPDMVMRTGLSLVRLRKIELGFRYAKVSDLHAICHALNIHPARLVPPEGMPPVLLDMMRNAVEADNDVGRPYAEECVFAMLREASLAERMVERELIRLKRIDHVLAYRALKGLVKLESFSAMTGGSIEEVISAVREDGLKVRDEAQLAIKESAKVFQGTYYPVKKAWDAMTNRDFDKTLEFLDGWRRVIGHRHLLDGMRMHPEYYSLGPKGKLSDRFVEAVSHALTAHEMQTFDERNYQIAVRQVGYLDSWVYTKPGMVVIERLRNRQIIMMHLPGLVEPLAKKPVDPASGPQFWLAKGRGPV